MPSRQAAPIRREKNNASGPKTSRRFVVKIIFSRFNPIQSTNYLKIGRSNIMQNSTKSRSQLPGADWKPAVFVAAILMMMTANMFAAARLRGPTARIEVL